MDVFCSICREAFSPDSVVNATPCGHLYHANCLDKWYEGNTTCPQCRSRIRQKAQRVEFLFRETGESVKNSSLYEKLARDYEVIQREEKELRTKYNELMSVQSQLKQKISECQSEIKNSEFDIVIWEKQWNMRDPVPDIRSKLLKENEDMVKKNNLLNKLNTLINGTEAEMYQILSMMPINECTLNELCTFVQAMKYKLKKNENCYKKKLKKIVHASEDCEVEYEVENREEEGKKFADKGIQTESKAIKNLRKKLLKEGTE